MSSIHCGTQHYGKVDHVPGVFYVVTSFFHINFMPLVPTGSYLILDGTEQSIPIGLSGKSLLFGYLRAFCVIGAIGALIAVLVALLEMSQGRAAWPVVAVPVPVAVGLSALWLWSYRLARPSAKRALELALKAGINPQLVVDYYGKVNPTAPLGKTFPSPDEAYCTDT